MGSHMPDDPYGVGGLVRKIQPFMYFKSGGSGGCKVLAWGPIGSHGPMGSQVSGSSAPGVTSAPGTDWWFTGQLFKGVEHQPTVPM